MRKIVFLPILAAILASLACSISVPTSAPAASQTPRPTSTALPPGKGALALNPTPIRETVIASKALNVRKEASERSAGLGTLLSGQDVRLTGICLKGWARIVYKGRLAWVKARFVSGEHCKEAE